MTIQYLNKSETKFQKKAILFDMDGTLVGLKPAGRLAILQQSLAKFGVSGIEQQHADRFWFSAERYSMLESWKVPSVEFWQELDGIEMMQLQLQYTFCYRDSGIIRQLKRQNIHLGIVSNSAHISLRGKLKLLSRYLRPDCFRHITSCSEDAPRTKPCPSGILLTLEKLGIPPSDALLVGDSMDDVRAGTGAGVDVVIIDRGEPIVFDPSYSYIRVNSLWKLRNLLSLSGSRRTFSTLEGNRAA